MHDTCFFSFNQVLLVMCQLVKKSISLLKWTSFTGKKEKNYNSLQFLTNAQTCLGYNKVYYVKYITSVLFGALLIPTYKSKVEKSPHHYSQAHWHYINRLDRALLLNPSNNVISLTHGPPIAYDKNTYMVIVWPKLGISKTLANRSRPLSAVMNSIMTHSHAV